MIKLKTHQSYFKVKVSVFLAKISHKNYKILCAYM